MQFRKLSTTFAYKTHYLMEALEDKGRGYCVVKIQYGSLNFAVPLRSNLDHINGRAVKIGGANAAFITDAYEDETRQKICCRGLDYQKALLLEDEHTDLGNNYPLPDNNQRTILNDNEYKITKQFIRYVDSYVRAHKRNLPFKNKFFKSTLVNYHTELDL